MTLHRWVGSRVELAGEVLSALAVETIHAAWDRSPETGGERLAATASELVEALLAHAGMQALLAREPEFAVRALTTPASSAQATIVASWVKLIRREREAAGYVHALEPESLAFVTVRLAESFVYKRALTGASADPSEPRLLYELIFRT